MNNVFFFVSYLQEANRIAKKAKPLLMKKMYVLTGLLMEKYHEQMKFNVKSQKGKKADVSSRILSFFAFFKIIFFGHIKKIFIQSLKLRSISCLFLLFLFFFCFFDDVYDCCPAHIQ